METVGVIISKKAQTSDSNTNIDTTGVIYSKNLSASATYVHNHIKFDQCIIINYSIDYFIHQGVLLNYNKNNNKIILSYISQLYNLLPIIK